MRTRENPAVKEATEKEKRNSIIDHMDSNGFPVLRFTTDEEAEKHDLDWQRRYNSNIARWRFNQLLETKNIEIDSSVSRTVMYKDRVRTQCGAHLGGDLKSRGTPASMFFENCDAVTALFKWGRKKGRGKICLVNFADYTKAGGGYLNGVLNAQEEAVCAESDLCNILFQHHSYYSDNEKDINDSLFEDRALYSPDVIFEVCDVLTIAAPNWKATKRSYMENVSALVSSIKYVAEIAADASVDTLIFGAFGCGVFGQDPVVVATASLCALTNCGLTNVVFAVPGSVEKEGNAKVFSSGPGHEWRYELRA